MKLHEIYMRAKKHAVWMVPLLVTALGGIGWWVQSVNADSKTVAVHEAIIPEIRNQLTQINVKQDVLRDEMKDGFREVSDRVSNLEGQMRR